MRTDQAAGGVVVGPDGKIVLVEQHGNSWSLPKGGVEEGESLLSAALREISEETGLNDLQLVGELGSYERKSLGPDGVHETDQWGSRKRTFFLFCTSREALSPRDREVTRTRWATLAEALELLTHPKDQAFLRSVQHEIEAVAKRRTQ
jgi:8-oxo-dGTP pyrophosphatase MutT (NUDIX family)